MTQTTHQPNILFIVLDTLRLDHLSAYGYRRKISPRFDDFAAQGALFHRAYSPAQWTVPSHASMFTGHYPSLHGVFDSSQRLPKSLPTLADVLRQNGYYTTGFCNNGLIGVLDNDLQRGFDGFYTYAGAANRPSDVTKGVVRRQLMRRIQITFREITNKIAHTNFMRDFAHKATFFPNWTQLINYKGNVVQTIDDIIDYWRQHGRGPQPLFSFVNLMGGHLPYFPPRRFVDKIAPDLRKDSKARALIQRYNDDAMAWCTPSDPPLSDWEKHVLTSYYDAEIAFQDFHLGRLFRFLRNSKIDKNTMVVVVADHGEAHGEQGYFGHAFGVTQEVVHVPLAIRYPERYQPGTQISENVSTRRLFHTMLQAAGATKHLPADDPAYDINALSLFGPLNPEHDGDNGVVFSEAHPSPEMLNGVQRRAPQTIEALRLRFTHRAILQGNQKLVVHGEDIHQAYTLAAGNDLSPITLNPAQAQVLQSHLTRYLRHAEEHRGETERIEVSEEVVANLRALGYME